MDPLFLECGGVSFSLLSDSSRSSSYRVLYGRGAGFSFRSVFSGSSVTFLGSGVFLSM